MRTLWPKDILNRITLVLIILISVFTVAMFLVEAGKPTPEECIRSSWQAVYIGWDDNAGPCTYPQRVVSNLFFIFVFPLLFVWPLTILTISYLIYQIARYRKVTLEKTHSLLLVWLIVLFAWSLFLLSVFV